MRQAKEDTEMQTYWMVNPDWGEQVEVTADELRQAVADVFGFVPVLVEAPDGSLRVRVARVYDDDHYSGFDVYEGQPEFTSEAWLQSGANWVTVAEPVSAIAK
jgi:hypothetical protein